VPQEVLPSTLAFLSVLLRFRIGHKARPNLPLNYWVSNSGGKIAHIEIGSRKAIQRAHFLSRVPRLLPGWGFGLPKGKLISLLAKGLHLLNLPQAVEDISQIALAQPLLQEDLRGVITRTNVLVLFCVDEVDDIVIADALFIDLLLEFVMGD
jgi:hypothetical protein